jgi:hypothetical protein
VYLPAQRTSLQQVLQHIYTVVVELCCCCASVVITVLVLFLHIQNSFSLANYFSRGSKFRRNSGEIPVPGHFMGFLVPESPESFF